LGAGLAIAAITIARAGWLAYPADADVGATGKRRIHRAGSSAVAVTDGHGGVPGTARRATDLFEALELASPLAVAFTGVGARAWRRSRTRASGISTGLHGRAHPVWLAGPRRRTSEAGLRAGRFAADAIHALERAALLVEAAGPPLISLSTADAVHAEGPWKAVQHARTAGPAPRSLADVGRARDRVRLRAPAVPVTAPGGGQIDPVAALACADGVWPVKATATRPVTAAIFPAGLRGGGHAVSAMLQPRTHGCASAVRCPGQRT